MMRINYWKGLMIKDGLIKIKLGGGFMKIMKERMIPGRIKGNK